MLKINDKTPSVEKVEQSYQVLINEIVSLLDFYTNGDKLTVDTSKLHDNPRNSNMIAVVSKEEVMYGGCGKILEDGAYYCRLTMNELLSLLKNVKDNPDIIIKQS